MKVVWRAERSSFQRDSEVLFAENEQRIASRTTKPGRSTVLGELLGVDRGGHSPLMRLHPPIVDLDVGCSPLQAYPKRPSAAFNHRLAIIVTFHGAEQRFVAILGHGNLLLE